MASHFILAGRLAALIRRLRRLRVVIHGPHFVDRNAVNLIVPSYNKSINHWLSRSEISGIVQSNEDACSFQYTDAFTGKTTLLSLPAIAENAAGVLEQLGF